MTRLLILCLLLAGCVPSYAPHPEAQAQRADFMLCMDKSERSDEAAYVCHVAVEIREWLQWQGTPVEEFKK